MTQREIEGLVRVGKKNNFIDITDAPVIEQMAPPLLKSIPSGPKHQPVVDALLPKLRIDELERTIDHLQNYESRYYTLQTGLEAAQWIHSKYEEYGRGKDYVEVSFFENSFLQPSVIAKIKGTDPTARAIVILGGHEDSTSGFFVRRSPGADDDASGTATVLEVFRVLLEDDFRPIRDIEFHAYAGEEAGLLGSQAIASAYQQEGVQVFGMMQLDMTGYTPPGKPPVVGLLHDFVNITLTNFVGTLIDTYANIGWVETKCGYGCSDHASWTRQGYPSSMPFEARFSDSNPNIHSTADLLDKLTLGHAIEFAKIGLAFVVELGLTPD